jgi:hypothetical protein
MLVSPLSSNLWNLHHRHLHDNSHQASPRPPPQAYLIPATMSASPTNITSPCPNFLAGFLDATVPYCALPSCANSTAIMAQCCAGSQVFPYHSARGPDSGFDNNTDLNALWCHVENSSAPTWDDCVGANSPVGMCADPSSDQTVKGWASRDVTVGLKTIVGFAVMVALFCSTLWKCR